MADSYTVSGPRPVLGREPGETVSASELAEGQAERLVARGQLVPSGSSPVQETSEEPVEVPDDEVLDDEDPDANDYGKE